MGHVADLQRLAGNRATTKVLQRAPGDEAVAVTGNQAARQIINWITTNAPDGQAVNYCVGVAKNDDLIISKVNGVTAATAYTHDLGAFITAGNLQQGRDIFLAQKFNTAVGSNHAEMCIMAAAGQGNVTTIHCSGPHCGFCSAVMKADGVTLGASAGDDHQQGWTHPFAPLGYGSQLTSPTEFQLAELAKLPIVPTQGVVHAGQWLNSAPAGKSKAWL